MRITIENEYLNAGIETKGVELRSLIRKEDGQEYIWEADPAFWDKTSPILFPFIGKLEDFKYLYHGKTYGMTKHGFARDTEFKVVKQEKDRVVFAMESTPETMENYPFPFLFEVEYRLEGNSLLEEWSVHNHGEETMYFAIGGHPAFGCPLLKNGKREGKRTDCFVKVYGVDGKEVLDVTKIDIQAGLTNGTTYELPVADGVFPIKEDSFLYDAIVFANQGVTAGALIDANGKEYVRVEAPSCPVWGIWSMPSSEPGYVCFEPWWGICGEVGEWTELEERPYTNHADAGKVWKDGIKIVIEA